MIRLHAAIALVGSIHLVVPVTAHSNEHADDTIDQIVVTGTRTPIELNRIGNATTVIDRVDIENRQARYVTDILRAVPGFAISHSGVAGSQTQVRVRGSEANHVLVLIDGVRANDPATGDEFRWEHLSTGNVERIEVIRGPQSALWGSDAIGAVVNVITRSGTGRPGLAAYAETGSHDTLNAGANASGQTGSWIMSANLESLDTEGANISRSGSEKDGSSLLSGGVGLRYAGEGNLSFDAGLEGLDAKSEFDPVDFFSTGLPADADVETRSNNLIGNVGAALSTFDDRVVWHLRGRYFDSEHRNFTNGIEESSTASERASFVLQSDINLGANRLVLAIEQEDTDFSQRGAVVFGDPNQDQSMGVTSAVAEYQYLAGDRWTWIVGGRYDDNSDFENAATGRLSVSWQATDETRLRASIGSGQKSPTFTERFGFFPGQFIGNPDLKPEKSVSYELGLEQGFLDGGVTIDLTVYRQELEDEINGFVFDPVTFLSTAENRPGTSERTGVEVAGSWRISDYVSTRMSYTYTDATEEDDFGDTSIELRRPKHMGSVLFDIGAPSSRFAMTFAADYGGTRSDVYFPPFPQPSQVVTLDRYWLLDLTAQYRVADAVTLFARGSNLLDEDYEQVFGYQTLGRTAYVGFRAEFGN